MSQRFEGQNLDDALQTAAQALGVERWQLTYHVLLQKRGFLGGVKRIVIEAEVNEAAAPPPVSAPIEPYTDVPAARSERAPRAARGGGGGGGRRDSRGGGRDSRGGRGGGGGDRGRGRGREGGDRDRGASDLRVGDFETFLGEIPEQGAETDAAKLVREWLEDTLRLANLDVVLRTEENETQILVRLYGNDGKRMIDRHGELLDAVQVLANKALTGRKVEKEIELDCEDFKSQRNEDLADRARKVADRVRRERREELLPAMSPIERRIVHIALRDDADVTTESRGEGFFKRVAVILRTEALPADPVPSEAEPTQEQ
ncbi:MAG TPA: R3H domain-containing nucleic acid-binding protein [Thermoanaerobaculia bacterium]|nr:R3H domain-containing nucleic acid-binding protein [Thermoanaerobaculia bacterium]